jgi:hypothetical protein
MSSAAAPATREELEREVQRLQAENDDLKRFFGYEADAQLEDMEDYKTECEEEDRKTREEDPDYAARAEQADEAVDVAVELSQCAYVASQLYGKMKKCSAQVITGLRKDFVYAFRALREVVDPERMEDFLTLVDEWLELERRVWVLEEQMKAK